MDTLLLEVWKEKGLLGELFMALKNHVRVPWRNGPGLNNGGLGGATADLRGTVKFYSRRDLRRPGRGGGGEFNRQDKAGSGATATTYGSVRGALWGTLTFSLGDQMSR